MIKNHPFRKKWGQNFLRDPNSIVKIVDLINPSEEDTILEIGPGDGALTDLMCQKAGSIHAVEIDPLLIKCLNNKKYENVIIHAANILEWDLSILPNNIKIIGNLPYYISTPILFRFLDNMNWKQMIFMFQKELAQRIVAKEGSKLYGRISVMSQVYSDVKIEFNISKNVFQPKPSIDSSVLSFYKKNGVLPKSELFSLFIKQVFSNRRKKLKNNLLELYKKGQIDDYANLRPESISPDQYIEIFKCFMLDKD